MVVLREYEDFYNTHRPHRTLKQAAPLRPLPDGLTDLGHFRVHRRDRAGVRASNHRATTGQNRHIKITWSYETPGHHVCAARDLNPEPAD